jgi:hypothetical protein
MKCMPRRVLKKKKGRTTSVPRAWVVVYANTHVHQASKLDNVVDDEYLIRVDTQIIHANSVPLRGDAVECERHVELTGEVAEPAPYLLDPTGWAKARLAGGDRCR